MGEEGLSSILDDDEIRTYVLDRAGDMGLTMCQLLEQGVTTIAELAEVLNMPRRATRQVLYLMNKERIVGYKRNRDGRRIVFSWIITPKKIRRMISNERRQEIRELEERLQFEMDHNFYECKPCNERYLFSEAYDFDFMCEHCGEPLEAHDNSEIIDRLNARIEELTRQEDLDAKKIEDLEEDVEDVEESPSPLAGVEPSEAIPVPKGKKSPGRDPDPDDDGKYYDQSGWLDEQKVMYYGDDGEEGDDDDAGDEDGEEE